MRLDGAREDYVRRNAGRVWGRPTNGTESKYGERRACDLHKLWSDRVLRARNPDGKDHGFKLKHSQKLWD